MVLNISLTAQTNSTKRVAILETVDKENKISYGIKLMVRSKLSSAITNTPGYEGYDRIDIAAILNEHEFQHTGLVSDDQIKQLGQMVGADYILITEVAYINNSNIILTAKILNVETARLLRTADIQSKTTSDELEEGCRILAARLLNINVNTGAAKGELLIGDKKYVGEYINNKPHGNGIMYYAQNDENNRKYYEGEWVNGIRQGKGTLVWNNGDKFIGYWKDGLRNGTGTLYYATGEIYKGNWLNGKRHGNGTMYYAQDDEDNRKYYEGEWVNGIRQGKGTLVWNNGYKFIGYWKDGLRNGKGTLYWDNGAKQVCNYTNGKENGTATYYWRDGASYSKGTYINGKKDGPWKDYLFGRHTFTKIYKNGKLVRKKHIKRR